MEQKSSLTRHRRRVLGLLDGLDPSRRIAFAALCAEILLPNYRLFAKQANWGKPEVLQRAVDNVWRYFDEPRPSPETIEDSVRECEETAPDTEQFGMPSASAALDAVTATTEALE